MLGYIYKAAVYCPSCGAAICARLDAEGKRPKGYPDERTWDSDDYPKEYTGGESDTPVHCDNMPGCLEAERIDAPGVFGTVGKLIDTKLTDEGKAYVRGLKSTPYKAWLIDRLVAEEQDASDFVSWIVEKQGRHGLRLETTPDGGAVEVEQVGYWAYRIVDADHRVVDADNNYASRNDALEDGERMFARIIKEKGSVS